MIGETDPSSEATVRIRELNDLFRSTLHGGQVMITAGVQALELLDLARLIERVRSFSDFTEANDPHGEHDFGALEQDDKRFFWKIDYYDQRCEAGSEDPADPVATCRVLTIMLAEEY